MLKPILHLKDCPLCLIEVEEMSGNELKCDYTLCHNYVIVCFCSKLQSQFQSMEVRNSSFAAYIDVFTSNTYAMVVMSDVGIRKCFYLFIFCH